jgi:predicted signal transduction protein with EAL and GGDEF domain
VAGDHLLREAATRLSSFEVEGMTIARIGGDEFAIVLERPITVRQIEMLGDGLIGAVRQAVSYGSQKLAVSASGGFANYPDMAADTKALYERADFALYKAKENQRGRTVVFNKENELEIREHVLIERAFREGDLENELFLMFQPQTNILTSKVVGFEALARWRSTSIGLIPPDLFIRVAEKSGYIGDITKILFRKGLQALASWPDDIRLSFNLSLHDVSNLDTIDWLIGQVKKSGLDPARIDFEITETAVMFDFELSSRALAMLVEMGAKIALDDFGSGHSSFEYIDRLPLHKIKIDKSFVAKVAHNRVSVEIVSAVLSLCRRLELDCVLEGVETTRELDVLRSLGAQLIQGYLFGRPMEGARVLESFMPIEHRLSA